MSKRKRKLTAAEKAEKKRRREEFTTIFINGKQKRVKRPLLIEGMPADEFIRRNAGPIFLHKNKMWEYMELPVEGDKQIDPAPQWLEKWAEFDEEIPF